ncbi:TPA: hypothetical protein ACTOBO_001717 [Campylobacter jejuni]|nr:hypothetical protein [Campylobacter jejuni]
MPNPQLDPTEQNLPPEQQNQAPSENDFDTTQDKAELNAIEAELAESRAAIDSEFIDKFIKEFDENEDLQNLFFEDKKAFFTQYEKEKQEHLDELVAPKMKKREELIAMIKDKEHGGKVFRVKQEFQKANPEVSMQELDDFYSNELSKRVQDEIAKMPAIQGYEKLLELFMKDKKTSANTEPPKKYNSLYMDKDANLLDVRNTDLPMNKY